MRGKRVQECSQGFVGGMIPAHAGKTSSFSWLLRRSAAHPRSRGENVSQPVHPCGDAGSSPLTRGKPKHAGRNLRRRGLIPAHAGKTPLRLWGRRASPAHPRSRGENPLRCLSSGWHPGSSPLTRGKRLFQVGGGAHGRLIPAHAGKTVVRVHMNDVAEAHPRSRGENECESQGLTDGYGSSPLTRGKRGSRDDRPYARRLIPAHAGKTRSAISCASVKAAHPRSRGENMSHG